MATVRYIVNDVDAAVAFYVDQLGFSVQMHPGPGFASLGGHGLKLLLNRPGAGGAGSQGAGGAVPAPGGWNRFQLEFNNLDAVVGRLQAAGCTFRMAIAQGNGGRQALVEDPSGNVVELFEPARRD